MRFAHHGRLGSIILVCLLLSSVRAHDESRSQLSASDNTALHALVEEFYGSYARKDLAGFVRLWSSKSPELAARRETMQKLFVDNEKIEVKDLVIRKIAVDGEKAKLRIELEVDAIEVKTSKPAAGLGKMVYALEGVKEEGAWKVWREEPAEADLAAALTSLKTEDERSALLAAEKELVTEKLVQELNRQGNGQRSKGNYPEALARFSIARKIAEQIGDRAGVAATQINVGNIYSLQSNYAEALEQFQQSLAISEAIGNKAGIAAGVRGLGVVYFYRGNYAQALQQFQQSLTISEETGDREAIARSLSNVGSAHLFKGDYPQALEYFQKSLALSESLGDKDGMRGTLGNIGSVYNRQGNYTQALEIYQKSLALNEAAGDKAGIARALGNIGSIYGDQGNYAEALAYDEKCRLQMEALGDKASASTVLGNMASAYSKLGNKTKALDYYQRSLTLKEAIGDKPGLASLLSGIGCIYFDQGNYTLALDYFQRSLLIFDASGERFQSNSALDHIGSIYQAQGNYAQALDQYEKSLRSREAIGDKAGIERSLHNLGNIQMRQGNYAQALKYFQQSLAISEAMGNNEDNCDTLNDMGYTSSLAGDYAQALEFAGRARALAKQFDYSHEIWRAQNLAGRSYRALNRLTEAHQAFEEAIAAIETLRTQVAGGAEEQQLFFEESLDPYQGIVELLVAQNEFGAALAFAERAKARVLLDVLRSGRVDVTKAMTAAEQEQERSFKTQLVSLNTQISRENQSAQSNPTRLNDLKAQLQKARLDYEAFQTGLYAAHPELKIQRGEIEALTIEQARALLPDSHSALLEYVVTDERAYLFALTVNAAGTTELKVYPLAIKQKELEGRVERFRQILAGGSPGFRQPASELYDLLLKPAAAQLQGRTSLVIVPDGALWELPFQTLQPRPNRYLIEDSAIAYAPSLMALREMNKLRKRKNDPASSPTLLAFGNPVVRKQSISSARPVLMDEKLEPLPEAERQVNAIRQIYGAAGSKVYIGAEASEEHAKAEAGSYRILHLATHGVLNDSSPMYSYLLLAQLPGDSNEDGLLEAWEIMKLDLKADLVVLSACETARGRVGAGEGMIGLSWALFVAGSPTSILSQWKVDSASTTELMVEFHRQLKAQMANPADSLSAARALREAELKLMRSERYRHPFYWAGFVVTGEGF
ncbi:MAG TPA: tetratricopeptide repeat protein [Pyrinomonadaceae bacterium]